MHTVPWEGTDQESGVIVVDVSVTSNQDTPKGPHNVVTTRVEGTCRMLKSTIPF